MAQLHIYKLRVNLIDGDLRVLGQVGLKMGCEEQHPC